MRGADDLFFLQGSAGGTLASLVDLLDKYSAGEGHALAAALLAGGVPSVTAQQGYVNSRNSRASQRRMRRRWRGLRDDASRRRMA